MSLDIKEWWSRGRLTLPRMAWKFPLTARQLLFELVYLAYYKPSFDRRTGEPMEAGSYRCTASFLANRLNRTVPQIRHDLRMLESLGVIERHNDASMRSHRGQKLSICNYRGYQGFAQRRVNETSMTDQCGVNNRIQVYKNISNTTIEAIASCWNEICGPYFPKVRLPLSDKRIRQLQARLKELPKVEQWELAFEYLTTSKFHRGDNDRGWVANFDYILRPDRAQQLLERLEAEMEGKK